MQVTLERGIGAGFLVDLGGKGKFLKPIQAIGPWVLYVSDEYSDFWFLVAWVGLGVLCGVLVGVPLWLATGVPQYVRWLFFLGIAIGGVIGSLLTTDKRRRRKKRSR